MIASAATNSAFLSIEPTAALDGSVSGRIVDISSGALQVRLAETAEDVDAAQALRYRIFYEGMGAQPTAGDGRRHRDFDAFDERLRPSAGARSQLAAAAPKRSSAPIA